MPGFVDRLKDIFGWPSSRRPMDRPNLRDMTNADQSASPGDRYHDEMGFSQQKRQDLYDVYDAMDVMSDISIVLDNYAEDATQEDREHRHTAWIEAKDKKVREEGDHLLHKVLHYEDWADAGARDLGKYGDDFGILKADRKNGIQSIFWRDPRDIERIENKDGVLIGFEETQRVASYKQKLAVSIAKGGDGSEVKPSYEPWDVVHFRIWKMKRLPGHKWPNIYGTSLLHGSERIAKQNKILDDLLMIMRLTRSMDRRRYMIDTGRSPVEEEVRILKRWKRALKRKTYVDPSTGRFDSRFDPYSWTEDEFWPVKEGSNSRVEVTEGITDIKELADIDHFENKLKESLRSPKKDDDINHKSSLSAQSIRWARAAQTLQRGIKMGLKRICLIHFAYKGMDVSADDFEIGMSEPSLVELLDKLEAWQSVVDVAERMSTLGDTLQLNKRDWTIYILEHVMWLSKQDVQRFARGIPKEAVGDLDMGSVMPPDAQEKPQAQPPQPQQAEPEAPPEPKEKPSVDKKKESQTNGQNGHGNHNITEIDDVIRQVAKRAELQGILENGSYRSDR